MKYLLVAIAMMAVLLFAGCSADEIMGVTKPEPHIKSVKLDRPSSTLTIDTNRVEFDITELRVWRMVDAHGDPTDPTAARRYLDFQYSYGSAYGDSGKAIFVLASWSTEALDFTSTYYALVELRAEVYVYDYSSASVVGPASPELIKAIKAETPELLPIHVVCDGAAEPPPRSTTEWAYDAGLWQLNPDGSSIRLQ